MSRDELQKRIRDLIPALESDLPAEARDKRTREILGENISDHKCDRLAKAIKDLRQAQINNGVLGTSPGMEDSFGKQFDKNTEALLDEIEKILASD